MLGERAGLPIAEGGGARVDGADLRPKRKTLASGFRPFLTGAFASFSALSLCIPAPHHFLLTSGAGTSGVRGGVHGGLCTGISADNLGAGSSESDAVERPNAEAAGPCANGSKSALRSPSSGSGNLALIGELASVEA